MVTAGGRKLPLNARHGRRLLQDTWVLALVEDDVIFWEGGDLDAGLETVDTAPDEAFAVLGDRDRVVRAAFDVRKFLALETLDHGRSEHDSFIFARTLANARLAVVVQAPSPDLSFVVDGKRVIGSALDVGDFVLGQTKFTRYETIHTRTLNDATTELVLLARTPSVNCTFFGKSEHVVSPADEVFDLLQARDEGWGSLDMSIDGEAENTFVALFRCQSFDRIQVGRIDLP